MRSSTSSSPDRPSPLSTAIAVVLLFGLALAACGPAATAAPSAGAGPTAGIGPTISGAWVRPPQGMGRPAAGYLVITGGSQADALLAATSPIAAMVEVHETTTDASGMTGMHPVGRLEVPAGATVALEPGGYHLMFMNLTGTLEPGSTVRIELTFEKAGKVTVQAEVKQG